MLLHLDSLVSSMLTRACALELLTPVVPRHLQDISHSEVVQLLVEQLELSIRRRPSSL